MSALTDQVDDHEERISELEDASDNSSQTEDDLDSRITDLESTAGQLQWPLSQDSIDLIKECFPQDSVKLVAGAATIFDSRISAASNIQLSVSAAGGTQGFLSYVATAGQAVITSTSAGDTSVVSYVLFS